MPGTFKLKDAILFDGAQQTWRVHTDVQKYQSAIPGMMAQDELEFLRWAAEHCIRPQDSIIDMGPLAGSSTLALATGLRRRGLRNQEIIHSYDLWRYASGFQSFFPEQKLKSGHSTLPCFLRNISTVQDLVKPHRGDIRRMSWDGRPIGILFLDAAKHPKVMAHVVREFLPSLREGGIFVQQDYVSSQHPWIHVAQELLMDHFRVADSPVGGTVNFVCTTPVRRGFLKSDYFASMKPAEVCRLIHSAASRVVGWERLCVELSESYYLLMRGDFARAESIVERVCSDKNYNNQVKPDVEIIQAFLSTRTRPLKQSLLSKLKALAGSLFGD